MAPSHGSQAVRIMVPGSTEVFGINSTGLGGHSHREDWECGRDLGTCPVARGSGLSRCWDGATAKFPQPVPAQDLLQGTREEVVCAEDVKAAWNWLMEIL